MAAEEKQTAVAAEQEASAAVTAEEEALSPGARLFHSPDLNCAIIVTLGCKVRGNADAVIEGLKHTLIKHPRFSSKLKIDHTKKGRPFWVRTEVKVEDHVIIPNVDDMENPDQFLEDYLSSLTTVPMDMSKPLWEIHLLNIKTSNAESVGVFKIHHSLGDGMSLVSLFLACTRKTSDPQTLPTVAAAKQKHVGPSSAFGRIRWLVVGFWIVIRLMLNTCIDLFMFAATICFLRDTETPLVGKPGVGLNPKRFVYRIVSLDDIKLVKNAMKMTVNDVLLGITQAGLSRYLNRRQDQEAVSKLKKRMGRIRLRAAVLINLRPNTGIEDLADMMAKGSKCKWGNRIGYVLIPFSSVGLENNPLEYIRRAKAIIDRKKLSLEAVFSYASLKFIVKVFGFKVGEALVRRVLGNTTFTFSNLVGPKEEISFYGHPISYIAPTVFGHPQALTLHFQSYANKMTISVAVDPTVIPDPHRLCDDMVESLKTIKSTVLESGLCNMEV